MLWSIPRDKIRDLMLLQFNEIKENEKEDKSCHIIKECTWFGNLT